MRSVKGHSVAVRVRLFAALRDAAGTSQLEISDGELDGPPAVSAVLHLLRDRFGEPFTTRLTASTVLLEGSAVAHDASIQVSDGAELALLPPVSGGSR